MDIPINYLAKGYQNHITPVLPNWRVCQPQASLRLIVIRKKKWVTYSWNTKRTHLIWKAPLFLWLIAIYDYFGGLFLHHMRTEWNWYVRLCMRLEYKTYFWMKYGKKSEYHRLNTWKNYWSTLLGKDFFKEDWKKLYNLLVELLDDHPWESHVCSFSFILKSKPCS